MIGFKKYKISLIITREFKLFFRYLLYGFLIYVGVVILDLITFGTLDLLAILRGLFCLVECSGDGWVAWLIVLAPYLVLNLIRAINRWSKLKRINKFIVAIPIIIVLFMFFDHLFARYLW